MSELSGPRVADPICGGGLDCVSVYPTVGRCCAGESHTHREGSATVCFNIIPLFSSFVACVLLQMHKCV